MLIKHQYINTACVFYLSNRLDGNGIMKTNGINSLPRKLWNNLYL